MFVKEESRHLENWWGNQSSSGYDHSQNFFSGAKEIPVDEKTKQFFIGTIFFFSCSKKYVLVAGKKIMRQEKMFYHYQEEFSLHSRSFLWE